MESEAITGIGGVAVVVVFSFVRVEWSYFCCHNSQLLYEHNKDYHSHGNLCYFLFLLLKYLLYTTQQKLLLIVYKSF